MSGYTLHVIRNSFIFVDYGCLTIARVIVTKRDPVWITGLMSLLFSSERVPRAACGRAQVRRHLPSAAGQGTAAALPASAGAASARRQRRGALLRGARHRKVHDDQGGGERVNVRISAVGKRFVDWSAFSICSVSAVNMGGGFVYVWACDSFSTRWLTSLWVEFKVELVC